MRLSRLNIKKINLNDIDKNYSGQDILMKLGELYQFESGIYGYGNIWTKLERNVENTTISRICENYVSICFLKKCYISLCQKILNERCFSECPEKMNVDSDLVFKRD